MEKDSADGRFDINTIVIVHVAIMRAYLILALTFDLVFVLNEGEDRFEFELDILIGLDLDLHLH
jgi:hypothetical protein